IYRDINILPFHKTGEKKYNSLNMKNYLKGMNEPSKEQVAMVRNQFQSNGFNVGIGG
ncbi:MAG: glycyl-radical enzyme activating protein, partial [Desulfobacula sp.]|nr:glycyl-radical enzyme activating protein [Desulfobacula sp.]